MLGAGFRVDLLGAGGFAETGNHLIYDAQRTRIPWQDIGPMIHPIRIHSNLDSHKSK